MTLFNSQVRVMLTPCIIELQEALELVTDVRWLTVGLGEYIVE